jgi:hypothetical protein
VYSIVYDSIGFHEFCARWVSMQLTEEVNDSHMDICSCHLEYNYNEELQLHHHWG